MMSDEKRRSKESLHCLFNIPGTIPEFSLKLGSDSSGGGNPVVVIS